MALFDNLFGKKLISPIPIPKEEPNWKQWLNLFLPKNKPENVFVPNVAQHFFSWRFHEFNELLNLFAFQVYFVHLRFSNFSH